MYSGLLVILFPLAVGYLIPLKRIVLLKVIHQLLGWIVYLILFLMGISLAFLDDLTRNLLTIAEYSAISAGVIIIFNLAGLFILERWQPWPNKHRVGKVTSRLAMALDSLKLCGVLALGVVVGLTGVEFFRHATSASEYTLMFLLFLVGIQLRNSGMSLRQIVLNRRGMIVALMVLVTSMLAGLVNALLLNLPLKTGLAMASGFGWYSLSGILMTESFGPIIGSASFFNDLIRELLAIMLIPGLINRSRCAALGLSGATSMDFVLPVLQRSGGIELVPAAIVHGFLLSLLAPVLIAFFAA